jgi:cytochrome c-type biogenesis protein CcsB
MMFDLDIYQNFLSNITFFTLILTTILYWINLILIENKYLLKFAKLGGLISTIILFFYLTWRWYNYKFFPLSNLYESLIFLACLLLLLYKFFEEKTKSKIVGSLVIPLVLLIHGFASLNLPIAMQKSSPLVPALQSNWLMLHVSMMMLSYSTLLFGSLFCLLYLALSNKSYKYSNKKENFSSQELYSWEIISSDLLAVEKQVKLEKNTNLKSRIRLLESLDNWSYRTIGIGFPFLTMGIISGAVWANEAWGSYWSWDPKETWALITWLIFAVYLHARLTKMN